MNTRLPPFTAASKATATPPAAPLLLVVDDREENLEAMRALLDDDPNWRLRCANSGEAALRILLSEDVSLVLLDVQMPGMDGYEVAELMRGNPKTRYTPIIFVSAIARTQELILRGYSTGAVDFILKPFDSAVLRQKVQNLLAYESNRRALQQLSQQLERERAFNASVLTNAAEGIMVVDDRGVIQYANPVMAQMTGRELADLPGSAFLDLLIDIPADAASDAATGAATGAATDAGEGDTDAASVAVSAADIAANPWRRSPFYRHWRLGGTYRLHEAGLRTAGTAGESSVPVTLSCAPLPPPQRAMVIIMRDISVERDLRSRLEDLIITDPLTGLLNRRGFFLALQAALARAKRSGDQLAVVYLDLDGFKHINDSLGHEAGDELLHHVAAQLKSGVRAYDSLARMGGDEFTVLLDGLQGSRDAALVVNKLMQLVSVRHRINGETFAVSASVGIAVYPDCGDDAEDLLRAADMAMYEAKRTGRQRYCFHSPQMTARAHARLELEQRLRHAVDQQQFALLWQPQYYLESGKLRGFEALLRWPRGNAEGFMPDQFIPLLEETRLINPLGQWIIHEGIARLADLHAQFGAEVMVSINVSPIQFAQPQLIEDLARQLHAHHRPATELASQLEIEVTESVLMENLDTTQAQLRRLSELGIKVAVDDFGTGYSSLAYLRQFDVDTLKIDKLFINNMLDSPRDAAVVSTILDLSRHLGLEVIAEGVETPEQRQWLLQHHCDIMQGWLVSPALSFDAALKVPQQLDWHEVPLARG